jgi:hypothetical protein
MTAADDAFDFDAEYGDEDTPPSWFPGGHLPADARRMGLTHHVAEGAILDFAGKLDATKPYHRAAAWVLLVVFGLPVVFAVLRVFAAF